MLERIIIVEDEKEIADLITTYLLRENFEVHVFYNGKTALEYMEKHEVDLTILDENISDTDGFTLCGKFRKMFYFPIIMLSENVGAKDHVKKLNVCVDDYLKKPFLPSDLVTRVQSRLQCNKKHNQQENSSPAEEFRIRELWISRKLHKCMLNEKEILFTTLEFDILWYLCRHQGEVVSKEILYGKVWEEKYFGANNTIMAHIAKVRKKLGESARNQKYIKTIWGVGYTIS